MVFSPARYRFTVKDYHRINAGVVHVATPEARGAVPRGESLAPEAFPDLVLEVAAIVG